MSSDSSKESPEDEPKIIVDDDWKEQVAKERELERAGHTPAAERSAESTSEQSADADAVSEVEPESGSQDVAGSPPPASFEVLVSMLFTQGMSLLGQFPDPSTGKSATNKPFAKHTIDTLEVLSEKTKGNLSSDEEKVLSEALHALRMAFVSVK